MELAEIILHRGTGQDDSSRDVKYIKHLSCFAVRGFEPMAYKGMSKENLVALYLRQCTFVTDYESYWWAWSIDTMR
jgi:hypothetical protein